ncbi:MAG: zf-HC2 domain-containing protein [Myxococcota bacterium]
MSQHVPEDLLQAFVDGEVSEQIAVHVAEHLDACPACATRATGLEPLAAAFASVRDPAPPPALAAAILAKLDEPERLPVAEIGVGAGLLAVASLLAFGMASPLSLLAELGVLLNASEAVVRGVSTALWTSYVGSIHTALAATTVATLAGALLTLHYAALPSSALRRIP